MITKRQFFKALHPALFVASMGTVALICGSSAAFAQVKIGSSPTVINPANNLEVESADPLKKVSIDKTLGKVTIADGSQGAGRVFTSDPSGVGTWIAQATQNSPIIFSPSKNGAPDQAVPLTTIAKINFGTRLLDKGNHFDLATDTYTVPANGAGYYQINSYFHSIAQTHPLGAYMYVYVNQVLRRVLCSGNAITGAGIVAGGSVVVQLNVDDVVDFRIGVTSTDVIVDDANVDVYLISK